MSPPNHAQRLFLFGLTLPLLFIAQIARAQNTSDEAAIRAAIKSYVEAYNRGDSKAVAEHWSEEGQWISRSGEKSTGKDDIAAALKSLFEERKGVTIEVEEPEIRLITSDVAVEEGVVHVSSPDKSPSKSTYQAIHVKHGGKWKLHSVRETEVVEVPAANGELQELAWLVGDWVDEAGASVAKVSWTTNKTFLNYSFKVPSSDGDDLEGTQVIGWDPAAETIRSWMFDSDGGFGEGTWSRRGDTWVVKFQQTLTDGRPASATNVYTLSDANAFTWKSIGRQIDGEFMPNVEEAKIMRKSTYEAAQTAAPSVKQGDKKESKKKDKPNEMPEQKGANEE